MYVCMYVRMYVCMYVCMYACMCVCVCVCVCVCISTGSEGDGKGKGLPNPHLMGVTIQTAPKRLHQVVTNEQAKVLVPSSKGNSD